MASTNKIFAMTRHAGKSDSDTAVSSSEESEYTGATQQFAPGQANYDKRKKLEELQSMMPSLMSEETLEIV